jgi:two-component system chemotaxis sensor kinase CheA
VDDTAEIVQEFLVESHENLDQLDRDLVELEQRPGTRELLSSIFRTIHTIKGTSGFLAFGRLEQVTHAGESLLSRLRDGSQAMTPECTDALLRMVDTVRALLTGIEETGSEHDLAVADVIGSLTACIVVREPAGEPTAAGPPATDPPATDPPATDPPAADPPAAPAAGAARASAQEEVDGPGEESSAPARRGIAENSIRVDVDLLDGLMRLVGELVLTRNQVVRSVGELSNPVLARTTQRLNLITSELQGSVMKMRMQPIEHMWAKLPRVVRDLSASVGKRVQLVLLGGETELDRTLLEAVKDPLTHLVRNAVDHGIESPEQRLAAGKPVEGTLTLRAYHDGGHVVVEIADDGAGIDPARVAEVALRRGLITRGAMARTDPRDVMNLIFQPGFSTAAAVTTVSGRGVGLDVVKTNIERVGGTVDVESVVGAGTTWRLAIPLTLAIIQALAVECAGQRFMIPQLGVHELVYLAGEAAKVEHVCGAAVFRLRGQLLPLVRLEEILGLSAAGEGRNTYCAVLQVDGHRFGLVVDRVLSTEEIVVKALSSRLKDAGVYAGATILGDGEVALILDVGALARRAQLPAELAQRAEPADPVGAAGQSVPGRLLVTCVGERRVAIPLDMVTRLEQFAADRIERVGSREVVQYNGQVMPLVRLADLLGATSGHPGPGASVPAVVYTEGGRSVALAVERIEDIVDDVERSGEEVFADGLSGSAVIQERITELLDVRRAILAADPRFYARAGSEPVPGPAMARV